MRSTEGDTHDSIFHTSLAYGRARARPSARARYGHQGIFMTLHFKKISPRDVVAFADDPDFIAFVKEFSTAESPRIDRVMLLKLLMCFNTELSQQVFRKPEDLFSDRVFVMGLVNGTLNCLQHLPLPETLVDDRIFFIRQFLRSAQDII